MKLTRRITLAILGAAMLMTGCNQKHIEASQAIENKWVETRLESFVAEKEAQADAAARAERKSIAPDFKQFFSAAENGDWLTMSNLFQGNLLKHTGQIETTDPVDLTLRGSQWETVKEVWGAFDAFKVGDVKYSAAFGNDITASIPTGGIFFGGTDPGRFIVTALQKSHLRGDPFYTLTQNALADDSYLDYLRSMYGEHIYIPTAEDSQKCFQDYMADVTKRQQSNQLEPGEDVQVVGGRVSVSGQVAVMKINGLLVKTMFEKNPQRQFYIEESSPLDWMYPNLEPHDLIMKINRQPLANLPEEIVKHDAVYWTKYVAPMIGDWLRNDSSVKKVAAFAVDIYVKNDLSGFTGDPQFIQNDYSCKMFSKLRSSIGGLYAWRANHTTDVREKKRMNDAADFAFRQAWALCPYSPEAIFPYVNLLLRENRTGDAILVVETAEKMPQLDADQIRNMVTQLKQFQNGK